MVLAVVRDLRSPRSLGTPDEAAAIRYCAEAGLPGYDGSQALEGAAGSAGRTESTSTSS